MLNLVPFGRQDVTKKGHDLPDWKIYQTKRYEGGIAWYNNMLCITGKIPGIEKSIIVFDFDGNQTTDDLKSIGEMLRKHDVMFSMVIRTGNMGSHFYVATKPKPAITNIHNRKLKVDWFPKCVNHVDVRGEGGIVFFPPTKFSDSPESYKEIWKLSKDGFMLEIQNSKILKFIDDIYMHPDSISKKEEKFISPDNNDKGTFDEKIRNMRKPLRDLVSPGARNIERISNETGKKEFLYWKALWIEAKTNKINVDTMFDLLAKYQPSFDKATTICQLPHVGKTPFSNEKLSELFPDYDIPIKKSFSEEIKL